jgi:hypothetical protein
LELKDLFLAPLYMLIFYGIATKIRNKHFKGHPFEPYFMKALHLKFFGAIGAGMVYWFYYDYGDTRGFFNRGKNIYNYIINDFSSFFDYMFPSKHSFQSYDVINNLNYLKAFSDTASYFMYKSSAFLSFFTFNTYTCIALIFAFFCFLSSLYFYKALDRKFPSLHKEIAIAIFFIPSVFFWGSGLFKDSLTFACLCLVAGGGFNLLDRHKPLKSFMLIVFGAYVILEIKGYILLSFAPCFGLYIFLSYNHKIKSAALRKVMLPLFLSLGLITGYFFMQQVSSATPEWSVDRIEARAKDMQQWHDILGKTYSGDGAGSHYSVGDIGDFSIGGMLSKFPLVISITFFQPFLWQVRSPFMLLTSLEGMFFLWLTIKLFKSYGVAMVLKTIAENPIISFCLSYALIFGFAVGYTSFNYGALARYKIPCLPFYLLFIYFSEHFLRKKKAELASNKL